MMSAVDQIITQVLTLETALYHAYARLAARTDGEALHDLRINLRRLRSLLHPLRGKAGVAGLEEALSGVGKLTTPVRDLEVLIDELRRSGLTQAAKVRSRRLFSSYTDIVESPVLHQLFVSLDEWPESFRAAEQRGELKQLNRLIARRLTMQVERLKPALVSPDHDPHRLRLLVKRVRYAIDAYPAYSSISFKAVMVLKSVQSALGTWHDRYQWCRIAEQEPDLEALSRHWHAQANVALAQVQTELARLAELLPASTRT